MFIYRPHKLWFRHRKSEEQMRNTIYMKMNLMLRQWTDSALWKNPSIGYQSQGINSLPAVSNAYSTDSVMGCQPICLTPMRCTQILPTYTWPISTCDVTEDLFEVVLFGLIFFEVHIHNFSTFQNINVSKSFFSLKDELDSNVNSLMMAQGQRNLL